MILPADRPSSRRIVVIGSGIAGMTAALHAHAEGCAVVIVTKSAFEEANTRYAQGGIAAVVFPDDRIDDHVADTLVAGAGLGEEKAMRALASEAADRIDELVRWGVAFDRERDGSFTKGLEAAHSYPRVLHAGGDATGLAIESALAARVLESGIQVSEHTMLVDLVRSDDRTAGVEVLRDDERSIIEADAVVLATGGAGQLYSRTTNPPVATGDGIAAGIRAGAAAADLEFVQFHPTVLAHGTPFLISEAVRGEGAVLRDGAGRRFALDAHPDGELAPRDVVARAIARTMTEQGERPVMLDATKIGADLLASRFPTIDRVVRERGLDWARHPLPVAPAAHYLMGGLVTDLSGRTSVPGLYAVGEVARTGVHGANRLASNSLLEGAVFGARAGDAVAVDSSAWPVTTIRGLPAVAHVEREADATAPAFSRGALQRLMWERAGLERNGEGLREAAAKLATWSSGRRTPRTAEEWENENLLLIARHVVSAALSRAESVGAHFRSDQPGLSLSPPRREDPSRAGTTAPKHPSEGALAW